MKQVVLAAILLALLLLSGSCTKEKSITDINILSQLVQTDNLVQFTIYEDDFKDAGYSCDVYIAVDQYVENLILKLDGNSLESDHNGYSNGHSYFDYYELTVELGKKLSYQLLYGDKTITGSILIPDLVNLSVPSSFNPNNDYKINWESSTNPYCFIVDYYFDDWRNDVYYSRSRQLSGSSRTYTVQKSAFYGFSPGNTDIDIYLYSINYHKPKDDFLTIAMFEADYRNYYKTNTAEVDRKARKERMLEVLKKLRIE